ncbi:peptidase [Halobaculum marinum]|uniref:Peptidase n=1 Tax=Halobaculum marinum TaxID=3031996 RepID=A0ABD5WTJ9_9EURY|nr:peptidase [Halobaculum sp. DT55]
MTLLCTGYEPFGDHETNPSQETAAALDGRTVAGHEVVGETLPVAFDRAGEELAALVDEHDPAAVVATGLAAGRSAVCVERVAINVADTVGVPDNDGADPVDEALDPDGADARLSTLPVRETVEACLDAGVPARVSNTAGTHLCNGILYRALALLEGTDTPAGFLHLPATPAQAAAAARDGEAARGGSVRASLPRELDERAVELAFETALGVTDD